MAKCRIGHFVEAQVLEAIGVDFVDESVHPELTPDARFHRYSVAMAAAAAGRAASCRIHERKADEDRDRVA
jgi:pyridoxal biosynthesis lyase PdxS